MNEDRRPSIDLKALDVLEERLRRGIPKWEHEHFIEFIVPQLVKRLQKYIRFDAQY